MFVLNCEVEIFVGSEGFAGGSRQSEIKGEERMKNPRRLQRHREFVQSPLSAPLLLPYVAGSIAANPHNCL
jgi:hypothetical protein